MIKFLWKLLSTSILCLFLISPAYPQLNPGFQSHNFQYLTGLLTPSQPTTVVTANAWNSVFPPKYYSLAVTTTASGFIVALQGSLDNANWSTVMTTNTVNGVVSSILPKPMLYFRMLATTIAANTTVTATAIGEP